MIIDYPSDRHDVKVLLLLRQLRLFFIFAGYRYLSNVDETDCRASCLLEEKCVAVQYSAERRGCKFLEATRKLLAFKTDVKTSKVVVFLPRLQREKENFILYGLRVKPNQQPRGAVQASNATECNSSCSQDAFCRAFVMCNPVSGSWCEKAKGNCLLYSQQQITAVVRDANSEIYFVWKDYTKVTENIQG